MCLCKKVNKNNRDTKSICQSQKYVLLLSLNVIFNKTWFMNDTNEGCNTQLIVIALNIFPLYLPITLDVAFKPHFLFLFHFG